MSISINNYLNGTLQNTWASNTEKQKQKDSLTEVGKTQQSKVSASLDQVNMGEDGVAITEVSRPQGAEPPAAQKQPLTPRMDTVEISEEGMTASTTAQAPQADASPAADYETDELSEYTDTELRQMYYRGEITRQEYENETGETLE